MDKSEPSLVPEWLRSTGGGTGGGSSSHHSASLQTNGPLLVLSKRTASSKSTSNSETVDSSFVDWTMSNCGSSSTNGYSKHDKNSYERSYGSFNRNHRDRDAEKLSISDNWDDEYSDPLTSFINGRIVKDPLRRSQSMVSTKQGEGSQRRVDHDSRSDFLPVGTSACGTQTVASERDFPLLVSEVRPATADISIVPSPGHSRNGQNLSIGSSALITNKGWMSALAEVPTGAGNDAGSSPPPRAAARASVSCAESTTSCPKMAEALVQAPARLNTAAQPSVQNQDVEELVVLQSMRLIPMTPPTSRISAPNPSDKLKPKTAVRYCEAAIRSKNGQQQLGSQSVRGVNSRADISKTSHSGKLLVLKPVRENGVPPVLTNIPSPTITVNKSVACIPTKNQTNPKPSVKTSTFGSISRSTVDRKASLTQGQSRMDFFNLMRKKSMSKNSASIDSESASVKKSDEELKGVASAPSSPIANGNETKCHGDVYVVARRSSDTEETALSENVVVYPDEKEAAFLRSLGWEEDAGDDDEGLTEEEINAFFQEVKKREPASKLCQSLQMKILTQFEPRQATDGAPSNSSI